MRKKEDTQLHFVGIGGIGMSGLAEVFFNQGYRVSGSDLHESESTRRLTSLGIQIQIGHRSENVSGSNVVVVSSAIKNFNPEIVEARRRRIPVIPRAEMLGELMRGKVGISVAGTHGKTTTTSMLATILTVAHLDPTLVIGGKVDSLGGNAKLGQGRYVVAEADESDGSFLHLPATYAVITNIDADHLDHFGSLSAIEDAFVEFIAKLPFYGFAAVCGEDEGVKRCLDRFTKPVITYGFSRDWDFVAEQIEISGFGNTFEVWHRRNIADSHVLLGEITLNVPGRHNILNALAAVAMAVRMEVLFKEIQAGISAFLGVRRRFEVKWRDEDRQQMIVDDYGHHPTEVAATLAAARAFWTGRIVTVFQPHRYTRTLHCREEFLSAFRDTDVLLLTDIYAAGEDPIKGVTAELLAKEIAQSARAGQEIHYVGGLESARLKVLELFADRDLVLCLGAGSVTKLSDNLAESISGISK